MSKPHEDQSLLASLFTYDDDGRLRHARDKRKARQGEYADTYMRDGYRRVSVSLPGNRRQLQAHRVVWVLHHGCIPDGLVVDHKDCNPLNNTIENLRLVTVSQNAQNTVRAAGYSWHRDKQLWQARICVDGVQRHLGWFKERTAARARYIAEKRKLHPTSYIRN